MSLKRILLFTIVSVSLLLSSCGINNNIIFKTGRNYEYDELPIGAPNEYVLACGDIITFRLFKNNGAELVENSGGAAMQNGANSGYLIRQNGLVELPYLGDVNLTGMTVKDAENFLELKYGEYFRDVFAMLNVTNKRVYISPGGVGDAKVIILPNNSTTLLEVLARAGGINDRGNSKQIKIIRNDNGEIKVYKIDLSTIDGIANSGFIVQANDFIYVEPMKRVAGEILQEVSPILSLISTAFLIYTLATTNPFK